MISGIFAIVVLDLKRFWVDRARLVAGLVQPLLYLFVLGAGIGASSRMGGGDYRRCFSRRPLRRSRSSLTAR
jgi:ABC-2 type transport system permease protein